jgi:glucose-1-phosphate cytidylyltransferase
LRASLDSPPTHRPSTDRAAPRPPVAILCGGRGTRLRERTREIPKPLVEIGGHPIVQHVIELYAAQGFRSFLLATGYRGELIERFAAAHRWPEGVQVQCVDTGLDTPTGGRIKLLVDAARLVDADLDCPGDGPGGGRGGGRIELLGPHVASARDAHARGGSFCVTYADGLADIDLARLLAFHEGHGALATMTVVRPALQFGVAELDGSDGRVLGFREKPRSEHWVNGGFFCLRAGALAYLREDSVLEREPLRRLAGEGQLRAYRHEGFWECMDTYKDAVALNDLWASGAAPWRR